MDGIQLARELVDQGLERAEIATLVRRGELTRLRRGAYAIDEPEDERTAYLRLIAATLGQADTDVVASHTAAAVLHGLPFPRAASRRIDLTRPGGTSGGYVRSTVHLHVAPVGPGDRTVIDGWPTTSLARTAVDVARSSPYRHAVAVIDAALKQGLSPDLLVGSLSDLTGFRGIRKAWRAATFADGRSESVGESSSRVILVDAGLPRPTLQYEVWDDNRKIARCDFAWEEFCTVGEFDGMIKYGRLLKPGQSVSDVIVAEKLREDAIRDAGWQVVRWIWADLSDPTHLAHRLHRAFARGSTFRSVPGPSANATV